MADHPSREPEDESEGEKKQESTPQLDQTIELIQSGDQTVADFTAMDEEAAARESADVEDTDANDGVEQSAGIEETMDLSQTDTGTVSPFGIGEDADEEKTVPNVEATLDMRTVQLRPSAHDTHSGPDVSSQQSVMASSNLSQTINPRELSKEDVAFWGSAALGASNANKEENTKLGPAIERSISESKLQIRKRDLAAPTRDPESPSDFRLIRLLGRGGMGNVYVARQSSLDRMIAVKVIKPLSKSKREKLNQSGRLEEVELERRQQFLSEAVVTSDLDHPNIVPIHDIAVASDDTLFYAMKRVVGEPWSKSIREKSRDENLEILLKVCDAIAFAHTRGVVHRDIKPENIMLGNFGEVLVMDWGLALAQPEFEKHDSITAEAGFGGTPAFMAPEMAVGPISKIGTPSDIYLLGATLYYIITGHPPHKAANVSQCIRAVASNEIQTTGPEHEGELLDIAMRAMATRLSDRFATVQDLQDAIRSYRSHSESVAISTAAAGHYEEALQNSLYESYSRATHGFEQAIGLWSGNEAAIDGLERCKIDYAKAAHANGDFDLGLSLLDDQNPRHATLITKLKEDAKVRAQRAGRLKLFRLLAAACIGIIIVGGTIALYVIDQKRSEANDQRMLAEKQTKIATERSEQVQRQNEQLAEQRDEIRRQKDLVSIEAENARQSASEAKLAAEEAKRLQKVAETKEMEAADNLLKAERQEALAKEKSALAETRRQEAESAKEVAIRAKVNAEYEFYLAQIGLAKARIDRNEFDDARRILLSLREPHPNSAPAWEWRWLWQQANQSESALGLGSPVADVAVSSDGTFVVAVCEDGSVHRAGLRDGKTLEPETHWSRTDLEAACVACDSRTSQIAIGSQLGEVLLIDASDGQVTSRMRGHRSRATDLAFLPNGHLLSASTDRTVALWNPSKKRRLDECWHLSAVRKIAAPMSASGDGTSVFVTASGDARGGRGSCVEN